MSEAPRSSEPATSTEAAPRRRDRIILRSYPKIILLYPTLIAAILAALFSPSSEPAENGGFRWGLTFLVIMCLNLIVLSFDFPRTTSFTLVSVIAAIVCGSLWVNSQYYHFLPILKEWTDKLTPWADRQFYWLFSVGMVIIYIFVFINTRFDFWEVMPNEIIHHHGMLGNVQRFPAPQLKLEKDITDVFEFVLLRSGRLLIHPSMEPVTIVLENVPNINTREKEIQSLLGVLDVHVHRGDAIADET